MDVDAGMGRLVRPGGAGCRWGVGGAPMVAAAERSRGGVRPVRLGTAIGLALCWVSVAHARPVRRLFEPTDLEFEDPGVVEADLQFGVVRGEESYRIAVPDAELDLGLTSNLEFDLDGQF